MDHLIELVVDRGSMFEIQPTFGRSLITCLARLGGYPVGIVANNPMVLGGAVDAFAARKQAHFIELCDCFHIPLVFLVDVPGFMVGTRAEQAATLREGMRALYVGLQASVPMFTVVIRKCYGMAGMATIVGAGGAGRGGAACAESAAVQVNSKKMEARIGSEATPERRGRQTA